jgi:hypothetical protein
MLLAVLAQFIFRESGFEREKTQVLINSEMMCGLLQINYIIKLIYFRFRGVFRDIYD